MRRYNKTLWLVPGQTHQLFSLDISRHSGTQVGPIPGLTESYAVYLPV